ncbi:LANO_0H10242g1_1 [Lachancea nothofagi CBS 11611]|uniref:LANO_0H10242g1_1 n=1 Tax=Lachancea nothofagi CBS 11611 TaxID=1266666 RepID=A0A1G4KLW3_9SACH|nr:LANO_0H10242g1_1 [Lachancea nothofagi CBS 11611]
MIFGLSRHELVRNIVRDKVHSLTSYFMSQVDVDYDRDLDSSLLSVSRGVVRHVLSLCVSQSSVITRSKLSLLIRTVASKEAGGRFKFASVYNRMNCIFKDTFGYELVGVSARNSQSEAANSNNLGDKAQAFMLVTNLPEPPAAFQALLLQEGCQIYKSRVVDDEYIGCDLQMISESVMQKSVSTEAQLVSQGLTFVVLAVVLFSKNNVLLQELTHSLQKFGVPVNEGRIPVLEMTLEDFLNQLVKRDYLHRIEERARDGAQEAVFFRVGSRTQVEFDKSALIGMCSELMELGPEQIQRLETTIDLSIGDSYNSGS